MVFVFSSSSHNDFTVLERSIGGRTQSIIGRGYKELDTG